MFLTVCLNPTLQKTLHFPSVIRNAVNRTSNHRLDVSGKGINVTRVLTQLGSEVLHLTHLGGVMKPLFFSLCEQDNLPVEWVESNSDIRFCYTVINESDSSVTEFVEESDAVCAETENLLIHKFSSLINNSSVKCFVISGTKAAGYSDAVIPAMVQRAKEKGLKIILDIKGNDLTESLKYEPDVIKPNLEEFMQTFKIDPDNLNVFVLELAQKYRCRVILTNGSRSILAADCAGNNFFEVDIEPVKAVNTIGCGDAFTAGLASALTAGDDNFKAAINEGIRCGALNAGLVRPGVIK